MAQLAVEHHQRVKMTCRTHQTLWIEFSTKPEVIVEKQTVNCSDEFNSVDVEFECFLQWVNEATELVLVQ